MAEKTEQATPKKLRDARKKGQVAKAQDFPSAVTFIVSMAATLASAGFLFQILATYMISTFRSIGSGTNMESKVAGNILQAFDVILNASLPILIITVVFGVFTHFIVVGPVFSTEAFKFDLKRLNPVTNIKEMFKFKTIFELLKSLLKITGAMVLIYTVIWNSLPELVATAGLSVPAIAEIFSDFLLKVIVRVGIFFLIVAVMDLIYQKKNFAKEMKMEKFEVKQEFKDTEGDPHIKSKRKQTAQEVAYQEGPPAVKRAKAVITNPVHIAVAIEYEAEKEPAPRIVTMGKGVMADLIIKAAQEYHVPIMRNVTLAQTIFEKGEAGRYIPEETFQAVAEILQWITAMEASEETNLGIFQ